MPRFVLKRQKGGSALNRVQVRALTGIRVIDELDDVAMLVEADAATIKEHTDRLAGWTITEEQAHPAPGGPLGKTQ